MRRTREGAVSRMRVGHQQHVRIEPWPQVPVQLLLGHRGAPGDEIQRLPGAVARHQDADVLMRDAARGRHAATPARRPVQRARPFLRLQQEHLVGLGNAGQALGPVVFGQIKKAVAPSKAGVAVHADRIGGRAHAFRIEHLVQVIEPFGAVAQARQRCAAERGKRPFAGAAAVALDAAVLAMPVGIARLASRTARPGPGLRQRSTDALEADRRTQGGLHVRALARRQ